MRYKFTESDLTLGAKLLCVSSNDTHEYTVGDIYEVIGLNDMIYPYDVSANNGYYVFGLYDINKIFASITFYPMAKLTEMDLFIFRLSGRLPYEV